MNTKTKTGSNSKCPFCENETRKMYENDNGLKEYFKCEYCHAKTELVSVFDPRVKPVWKWIL